MRTAATHPAAGKAAGESRGLASPPWRRADRTCDLAAARCLAGHVVLFTAWTTWVSFTARR